MTEIIITFVTCGKLEEARQIAKAVVTERLAACVNIVAGISSFFFWEGKFCDDPEHLLIIKSTQEALPRLQKRIKELHSYTVPEILSLPVENGHADYLKWVRESVS